MFRPKIFSDEQYVPKLLSTTQAQGQSAFINEVIKEFSI